MKYQDKISKAHLVLNYFKNGKSEYETIAYLKSKGLSDLNISSVMIASRNIFYDEYAKENKYNIESLKTTELKNTDSEWLIKYDQHVIRKNRENEDAKLKKLLDQNATKHEIEANIDTNTISKETIDKKLKDINKLNKKQNIEGYISAIGGLGLLLFYEFTLLKGRPVTYLLVMGLFFITRGVYSIYKSKKR